MCIYVLLCIRDTHIFILGYCRRFFYCPCAQARSDRTAREQEARLARNMMSNHTDMHDKYFGHCHDIHPIRSQYKGNHKRGGAAEGQATSFVVTANGRYLCILALNRVNVVAVTTILVLHVGVIGQHIPRHYDFMPPVISNPL